MRGEDGPTWDITAQCQDEVDPEVPSNSKPRCNSYEVAVNDRPDEWLERYAPSGGNKVPRIKIKIV